MDNAVSQLLLSHVTDLLLLVDSNVNPVYVSPSAQYYLGDMRTNTSRTAVWRLVHPRDRGRIRQRIEQMLRNEHASGAESLHVEFTLRVSNTERIIEAMVTRVQEPIEGLLFSGRDITDQRELEGHFRTTDEYFTAIFGHVSEGVALVHEEGHLQLFTGLLWRNLGHVMRQKLQMHVRQIIAEEDYPAVQRTMESIRNKPNAQEYVRFRLVGSDGTQFHVEGTLTNLLDEASVRAFVFNLHDTTETVVALDKVRQLNDQLEQRVEHLETVRRVQVAIRDNTESAQFLGVYVMELCAALQADAIAIHLANRPGEFVTAVGHGFSSNILLGETFRSGEGLAGKAVSLSQMMMVEDLGHVDESGQALPVDQQSQYRGYLAFPLVYQDATHGVIEFFFRESLPDSPEWFTLAESLISHGASALAHGRLVQSLERTNKDLTDAYDRTIEGWAYALDLRDEETVGHSKRVTDMTLRLAHHLGVPDEDLTHIQRGALLHDIGKMGIPDSVLLKQGKLTAEEFALMKKHPEYALEMLQPIAFLGPALEIPYSHHERWDGSGYPEGLSRYNIPLAARIFSVVDVYDALTSNRPYRDAWTHSDAINYLYEQSGKQFDPEIVEAFINLYD